MDIHILNSYFIRPIEVVVGINLCEGLAEGVAALLAVTEILTDEDSFKSSAIRVEFLFRNDCVQEAHPIHLKLFVRFIGIVQEVC